jgi:HSP20 family protein
MMPSPFAWGDEADVFHATQRAAERLMGEAFNASQSTLPWMTKGQLTPTVDITETDKAFTLRAELPGMGVEDIDVSCGNGILTLRGEKQAQQSQENEHCLRRECCYGTFERIIALPKEAQMNKAEATFKNNVLSIQIPKMAKITETAVKIPVREDKGTSSAPVSIKTEAQQGAGHQNTGHQQAKKIA